MVAWTNWGPDSGIPMDLNNGQIYGSDEVSPSNPYTNKWDYDNLYLPICVMVDNSPKPGPGPTPIPPGPTSIPPGISLLYVVCCML